MQDKIKASNWALCPVELLSSTLTMKARICYVAMRSFGPESRASLKAIAFRMGVNSLPTVREAQRELSESGWIELLSEGKGGEESSPREWEIKDTLGRVQKNSTLQDFRMLKNDTRNREGNQTEKEEQIQRQADKDAPKKKAQKHSDQDAFWSDAKTAWHETTKAELTWPQQKGFGDRLTKALTTYGGAELSRRFKNYMGQTWMTTKSLSHFLADPDRYVNKPTTGGANNGSRGFNQATTDWKPSGMES